MIWVWIWKITLVVALGLFIGLSVVVIVGGVKEIVYLFKQDQIENQLNGNINNIKQKLRGLPDRNALLAEPIENATFAIE